MGAPYFSHAEELVPSANLCMTSQQINCTGRHQHRKGTTKSRCRGLVAPRLDRLIQVSGSSVTSPAKDILLSGLTLMHSAPTFCCDHPYESVSGGDWSLHRGAAVFFENVTDSTMSDCLLDHPEGNGIILNGYTERLSITRNEVASSGDSSVISVGVARFMDGRAPHPRNNTVSYNHLHHWGVWGKQTSAYLVVSRVSSMFSAT